MTSRAVIGSGVDADAAAFCRRSGATDRTSLSAFVRGVKGLGLWGNFVCWPMTGGHSAQSGATVHSLGGMGVYDGTFSSAPAPTWSARGVVCVEGVPGSFVTTASVDAASNPFTVFSVIEPTAWRAGNNATVWSWQESGDVIQLLVSDTGTSDFFTSEVGSSNNSWRPGLNATLGAAVSFAAGVNGATKFLQLNGGARSEIGTTVAVTPTAKTMGFGVRVANGDRTFAHTQCFQAVIGGSVDAATVTALHELYRRTLGRGLGLP